jgi:polysaccharide biosynthesis/export protein
MFKPLIAVLFGVIAFLACLSCKAPRLFETQESSTNLPSDSLFLKVNPSNQYVLRKDDKLNISIWNNDDVSVGSIYGIYNSDPGYGKWLMVDARGEIAIPKMGNVKVEGLTIVQLKELLVKKLSETIINPVIDIKVLNKEVTVLGLVKTPGKIHLEKENYTLTDILGMVGDFDNYGNKARIQVIRIINDTPRCITVDLTSMKGFQKNNIQIVSGDIVYVAPRKALEWDKRAGSVIIPTASAITAMLLIFKTFF